MRLIMMILTAILFTTASFAQNNELTIKGLVSPSQSTKLVLTEVQYQDTDQDKNRKGGVVGANIFIVTKNMDGNSSKIEKAVNTGKVFSDCQIWLRRSNGQQIKYKLDNASLTNYSAMYANGKNATESFIVRFSKKMAL